MMDADLPARLGPLDVHASTTCGSSTRSAAAKESTLVKSLTVRGPDLARHRRLGRHAHGRLPRHRGRRWTRRASAASASRWAAIARCTWRRSTSASRPPASSGFMSTVRPMMRAHVDTHSWVHFVPGLHRYLDLPDVVALRAPRRCWCSSAAGTACSRSAGMEEAVEKIAAVYARPGSATASRPLLRRAAPLQRADAGRRVRLVRPQPAGDQVIRHFRRAVISRPFCLRISSVTLPSGPLTKVIRASTTLTKNSVSDEGRSRTLLSRRLRHQLIALARDGEDEVRPQFVLPDICVVDRRVDATVGVASASATRARAPACRRHPVHQHGRTVAVGLDLEGGREAVVVEELGRRAWARREALARRCAACRACRSRR